MTAGALTLSDAERRVAERVDPAANAGLVVSREAGGVSFANAAQLMDFAKLMAVSSAGVRKHLRGNPGACLAICTQAVEWGMSPYAVANKSYFVNDQIAYESQLVQAVILKRAPIKGRIRFEFEGEGEHRVCIASARLRDDPDEVVEYRSPPFSKITPKNSPLWKSDPDQQHAYYSGRALCRRHFPDVLLGVYADDEIEIAPPGPAHARDVTPPKGLAGRLDALAERPVATARTVDAFETAESPGIGSGISQAGEDEGDAIDASGPHAGEGAGQQPDPDTDSADNGPPPDAADPDFQRGVTAKRQGKTKCLNPDIRDDDRRMAMWVAGFNSVEG